VPTACARSRDVEVAGSVSCSSDRRRLAWSSTGARPRRAWQGAEKRPLRWSLTLQVEGVDGYGRATFDGGGVDARS